jgi:gliding motility-associated-like protein
VIDNNNNPIVLMSDSVPENKATQICLKAYDADGNNVTLVNSISVLGNGTVTGMNAMCFTYQPNKDFTGKDSLLIVAADDGTPVMYDTLSVSLNVYFVNTPPVILDVLGQPTHHLADTTLENVPVTICLNASDYDQDIVTISSVSSLSGHTQVDTVTGSGLCFNANPAADFHGTDSIRVIVSDNRAPAGYDTAVVYLYVRHHNHPPVILNADNTPTDTLRVDAFENETTQVCLNVSDPDNDITSISVLQSLNGSGTSVATNNTCFDYTPARDFLGSEVLFVTVCDNGVPSMSDTVFVIMNVIPHFIFSQVISPNGDGVNDTWVIGGLERFPDNKVTIFSRWGDIVYKARGYDNVNVVWNGNYNNGRASNGNVPDGTYFYIIDLGNGSKLTGFIVLNR